MKCKHRPSGGFTLLELVVVVAVVAILGTALLSLVSASGSIYNRIQDDYDAENEARIALSYITIKVRQNDYTYVISDKIKNSVKLVDENGIEKVSVDGSDIESDYLKIISSDFVKDPIKYPVIDKAPVWKIVFDKSEHKLKEYHYLNETDYFNDSVSDPYHNYPDIAVNLDNVDFIYDPKEKLLTIKITYTVKDGETRSLEGKVYLRSE